MVYPQSFALIKKSASVKLEVGEHKVIFLGIIPEIDEDSLRVSASGTADFKLFGARIKKDFPEEVPSERIKGGD